ncbi:MAG: hypothetical protein ABIY51_05560 [Ferruginibacter sp.]
MRFCEIPGQKEVKQQLVHMVQQNRLSHALLFLSREGSGALSLAQALAQYIVCERTTGSKETKSKPVSLFDEPSPAPDNLVPLMDSCGECAGCKKASHLVHPDIHFSYPVITKKPGEKPKSVDFITEWREFVKEQPYGNTYDWLQFIKAENKQGNITSEECMDIIRKMNLKSFESEYKILIIWMPELLGKEGNKLLKLIEEPPPSTLFILVAENESLILPTIVSRTQLIKIPLLRPIDIEASLELKEGIPVQKAAMLSILSEGNYREALQQLQLATDDWDQLLKDWLNSIVKTGPAVQLKIIEEISKLGREKQKQFIKYFTHILQHSIRLQAGGDSMTQQQSLHEFSQRINRLCNLEQKEAIVNELDKAAYYIERNANAKMLFHALTIRLYHIISNKSVILVQ